MPTALRERERERYWVSGIGCALLGVEMDGWAVAPVFIFYSFFFSVFLPVFLSGFLSCGC